MPEAKSCFFAEGRYAEDAGRVDKSAKEPTFTHPYWYVNNKMPPSYWDYENAEVEFGTDEPYELIQKIGRGKYSEVFRARNRLNDELCVLKVLKPVRLKKIRREITILQNLCGGPNVVRLLDVVMVKDESTPVLVTENIEPADNFRTLMSTGRLSAFDMRYYLYEILRSLDYAHSRGIFHRDIKPQNVIIDHQRRKIRIVDWGLAEYYIHGQAYNVGVGTRHFKGPELLVGLRLYDYSLDMWSVGCMLAELLFHQFPFFRGDDNVDQLQQIVNVMGTDDVLRYVQKYKIQLSRQLTEHLFSTAHVKRPWTSFVNNRNMSWVDQNALELLDRLLRVDHQERILAHEAMQHPFFDPVRRAMKGDPQEQYPKC
ncbi:Protein kinase domain [Trypanosoma vivax]|uniref:non-specific serine/threonine protein kinase n=1 Tax=Trypanosoma vivax (strain Y486) TaxID=1055687 RepID=G0TRQ4_TRYVY|nr:putative casein kinase II, alpha chain [Trypanosoma vivax]KAH8607992.1 Protein kinase domain [Trypanosoma vivax]CCC46626.1 putative casein kinase II, alpha chain [Trypanosoma vivax Y486]